MSKHRKSEKPDIRLAAEPLVERGGARTLATKMKLVQLAPIADEVTDDVPG